MKTQTTEQQWKKINLALLQEMRPLQLECDYLIKTYELRNIRIDRLLCKRMSDKRRQKLSRHRLAVSAKLGAVNAFRSILNTETQSLIALQNQLFQEQTFQAKLASSQQKVCIWASKVLSKEAPWQLKHHYRPFAKLAKRIGNIILPFTVVGLIIQKAVHGTFFFSTKTDTQRLAKRALTKLQRHSLPQVTIKPVVADTGFLPQQEKKVA